MNDLNSPEEIEEFVDEIFDEASVSFEAAAASVRAEIDLIPGTKKRGRIRRLWGSLSPFKKFVSTSVSILAIAGAMNSAMSHGMGEFEARAQRGEVDQVPASAHMRFAMSIPVGVKEMMQQQVVDQVVDLWTQNNRIDSLQAVYGDPGDSIPDLFAPADHTRVHPTARDGNAPPTGSMAPDGPIAP